MTQEVFDFARSRQVELRDTIVLLPFAQHLPLARAAWGARPAAGWAPRFETTQTLARSHGPAAVATPGVLSFDATADALQADRMLRAHFPAGWADDARHFDLTVRRVVETAHALARARLALPHARRSAWTEQARAALTPSSTARAPGAMERALARLAFEWAETAPTDETDALHAQRPAAWVLLQAGAVDPLAQALLSQAEVPTLWLDADVALDATAKAPGAPVPGIFACADLEDEAQHAAAQVLVHIERGELPVALIALDRVLLRRVRALLERQHVLLADETGWRLSTTRAGASVVGLLRAAHPRASTDEVLDWLASAPAHCAGRLALEADWRRHRVAAVHRVKVAALAPAALAAWQHWQFVAEPLASLHDARRASLGQWLAALRESLARAGTWETLAADAAGAQVFEALHGATPPPAGSAWAGHLQTMIFDAAAFGAWAEAVLEAQPFRPGSNVIDGDAPVVITPLARAMLRPFAAIVCPGADAQRLGAAPPPQPLLGDTLACALGLPGVVQRQQAERLAFAQLLRSPRLTLTYRRLDGAEPLQPSPWVRQLQWLREQTGPPAPPATDPRELRSIVATASARPQPTAPSLLPDSISATVYEALRACPYRFFAQHALRLDDPEELDDALDKRDYGHWLHSVLQAFHAERDGTEPDADHALLRSIGRAIQAQLERDDADFLPFAASFDELVPQYLHWLHGEEANGASVRHHELSLKARPAALTDEAPALRGRLDRVDALRPSGEHALRIVDYKTTAIGTLQARLREPLEDTQLAFYAALLSAARDETQGGIEAGYLALDSREGVRLLMHPQVEGSAAALIEGVSADFARLRQGAAMPALGEGTACEHCSARGLCRRDHWPPVGAGEAGL